MKTDRSTLPSSRRALSAWMITLAATAASTYALDAVATAAGVLLVASGLLSGLDHSLVLAFLAATYVLWGVALRANLGANWLLLRRTGTSTNVLSKAAFELTGRRGARVQRVAAGAGYVATELAKEAPYYAGAFGAAALTNSVSSNDALLFLAGTNLGAAAYEYVLARLTRRLLRRRTARPPTPTGYRRSTWPTTTASSSQTSGKRSPSSPTRSSPPRPPRRSWSSAPGPRCITSSSPRRRPRRSISPTTSPRTSTRSNAGARATRPPTTGAPSSATRSNAKESRSPPTRRSRGASSSPAPRSRDCSRSTRATPSPSTSATRRSSAPIARTPLPTIAPPGRPSWRTSPTWSGPAACSSRPPCAAAAPTWSATSDSRARTSTSTNCDASLPPASARGCTSATCKATRRRAIRASSSRTHAAARTSCAPREPCAQGFSSRPAGVSRSWPLRAPATRWSSKRASPRRPPRARNRGTTHCRRRLGIR